jgi:hypothetical protein
MILLNSQNFHQYVLNAKLPRDGQKDCCPQEVAQDDLLSIIKPIICQNGENYEKKLTINFPNKCCEVDECCNLPWSTGGIYQIQDKNWDLHGTHCYEMGLKGEE